MFNNLCLSLVASLHLKCHELLMQKDEQYKLGDDDTKDDLKKKKSEVPGTDSGAKANRCPDCLKCSHCGT